MCLAHFQNGDITTSQVELELSPRPHKRARTEHVVDSPVLLYPRSQELLPEGSQGLHQRGSKPDIHPSPPSIPPDAQLSPPETMPILQHKSNDTQNFLPSPEQDEREFENTYPSSQSHIHPQASSSAHPQTPPISSPGRHRTFSQIASREATPAAGASDSHLDSPSLEAQVADALHAGVVAKKGKRTGRDFGARLRRVIGWSTDESDRDETGNEETPHSTPVFMGKNDQLQEIPSSQDSVDSRENVETELTQELDNNRNSDEIQATPKISRVRNLSNSLQHSDTTSPFNQETVEQRDDGMDMDAELDLQWPESVRLANAEIPTPARAPSTPPRRYRLRSRSQSVVQLETRPKLLSLAASKAMSLVGPNDAPLKGYASQLSAPLAIMTQANEPSNFSYLETTQSHSQQTEQGGSLKRTRRSRTPTTGSRIIDVDSNKNPSKRLLPRKRFRSGEHLITAKVKSPPPATAPKTARRAAPTPDRSHRPRWARSHSRSTELDHRTSHDNTRRAYNTGALMSQSIAEASFQDMDDLKVQTQDSYYSQQLQTQAAYQSQSLGPEDDDG